ncbi:hypothetical protein LZG04_04530 [Saccharothrix sp. S26]|uniref:hypothetical protein n=1 Tax=Saccharothrix sp. S26 TaxID=2907215 RepID=UPI001F432135|nr:hypothetical protein [Saccharothrix sp. S26]MCE6994081.1 hypothetical protein [Saccharothrix sp. S26]
MTTPGPGQAVTPPTPFTPPAPTPPNGVPLPHPPSAPPARAGRAPLVALTALAAVLAVATGVFTVLYLGERADRDATAATRAEQERTLADVTAKQGAADTTLEGNRSRESTLTAEHDLLTQCVDAAKGYFALPPEQTPESSRLFRIMYDVCPQI